MLSVKNLTKIYQLGKKKDGKQVVALNNVSIDFPEKGLVFLLGKSGSGKSTLLNAIGGLDTFDSGEIIIKGKSSRDFKQSDFDSYRNTFIGFIFQEYNILEEFSVGKNLALALELQGKNASKENVEQLLDQVDLSGYYKRKPNQLSGGQKQRVAIARALIKDPEIIMADEPTGALDSNTGKQVMDTLKKLSKTKLVIIVSHDREFAEIYGDRVVELKDGQIIKDETKTEVIAQKSASGVSYIDDKIIHIKKGQKVSKDDLDRIAKMLDENSEKSDTIISFDEKSNVNIKKTSFITDEGNREVFKKTEKENIITKQYDPKDFKLIKSKLKFKDSFKMGASSLKHKPVRLVFTILLSFIAFAMFGLVDTLSSFNRTTSIYESMKTMNVTTVAAVKQLNDESDTELLWTAQDLAKFEEENPGYKFAPVINSGNTFYMNEVHFTNASYTPENLVSGVMAIDDSVMSDFELQLIEGDLPSSDDEVCISANVFELIKENSETISTFDDIKGKAISFGSGYYMVTGVVKDDTDISRYQDVGSSSGNMSDWLKQEEKRIVFEYSLVNMFYVSNTTFNTLLDNYSGGIYFADFYTGDRYGSWSGIYANQLQDPDNLYVDEIEMLKTGLDAESLTLLGNQVVVGKNFLIKRGIEASEIATKINEGLKIPIYYTYSEIVAFELEVVGVLEQYTDQIYASDGVLEHFKGFDYAITRIEGNANNKELVEFIENYNKDNIKFAIQFASTPILDNFGSMITSMAQAFTYVGIALAVFAALMLMNFISTSISYKKREIGVLRAIGARGKDVFAIFFSESFIICMINFILATIGCGVACFFINRSLFVDLGFTITLLTFGIRQVMLMLGISVLVAFVSSFIPVYKIAKKNPIDSINNR